MANLKAFVTPEHVCPVCKQVYTTEPWWMFGEPCCSRRCQNVWMNTERFLGKQTNEKQTELPLDRGGKKSQ